MKKSFIGMRHGRRTSDGQSVTDWRRNQSCSRSRKMRRLRGKRSGSLDVLPRKRRVVPAPDVAQDGRLKFRHDVQGFLSPPLRRPRKLARSSDRIFSPRDKNFAMKLALGLDVQTNAKGGAQQDVVVGPLADEGLVVVKVLAGRPQARGSSAAQVPGPRRRFSTMPNLPFFFYGPSFFPRYCPTASSSSLKNLPSRPGARG